MIVFVFLSDLSYAKMLVLKNLNANKITYLCKVSENDTIKLHYIQSLYKVSQYEIYRVVSDKFFLMKVIFGSYDSALYYNEDPIGGIKRSNGYFYIDKSDFFKEIPFILAENMSHMLYINDIPINLYKNAKAGCFVKLYIDKNFQK